MSNLKYKHTAYTSAQWASLNPVIVENEIVIESDTKRTKIGNGISTYNELEYADANSVGNSLGSIKPTDAAPTPARNGNYTFSIGGAKPAWLTAEPLVTEVKAGDGVAVVYSAPSSYSYSHVDVSSEFVTASDFDDLKMKSKSSLRKYTSIILGNVYTMGGDYVGRLETNTLYDCTEPIKIIGSVGSTIKTTGVTISRYMFYNSSALTHDSFISGNTTGIIPVGATYVSINFLKTDNVNGYSLLDISFENSAALRKEFDLISNELNSINTELNLKVPLEVSENILTESLKTPDSLSLGSSIYGIGSCLTGLNGTYEKIILNITQKSASPITKIKLYKGSGSGVTAAFVTLLDEIVVDSSLLIVGLNEINLTNPIPLISTDYLTVFVGIATTGITFKYTVCRDGDAVTMKNGFVQTMENAGTSTYLAAYSPVLTPLNYGLWWKIKTIPSIPQEYLPDYEPLIENLENRTTIVESKTLLLENAVNGLKTIKNQAKTLAPILTNQFNSIKPQFQDIYCVMAGDSICAFQSTYTKDSLGVTRVPPVCDRKATANMFWNAVKWGSPEYRRFDDGRHSLVGNEDSRWVDDSAAFFTETGVFNTEYIGAVRRAAWGNVGGYQVSTNVNYGSFTEDYFDNSETSWWQRNIPKRFSNAANASVQFIIPVGYSKFDFIFHAHLKGDNITITTNRSNGIIKLHDKQNDWINSIEANGAIRSTALSTFLTGSGDDTRGITNKRLHFKISDTSVQTVITITKTAATDKYLIYWGATYWGTPALPYAFHLDVTAIGGYSMQSIYALRGSMLKAINPDAIIMEICFNNLNSSTFEIQMGSVNANLDLIKTYVSEFCNNIALWIPHKGGSSLSTIPDVLACNHKMTEKIINDKNMVLLFSASKIFEDVVKVYYPTLSLSQFMLNAGDVHLNDTGHQIYSAIFESL